MLHKVSKAQTLANVYLALDNNLEIIPVINKIDLPSADPEKVKKEIEDIIGIPAQHAILASAKSGIGIEDILEEIVHAVPAPKATLKRHLKHLFLTRILISIEALCLQLELLMGS